jgi:hypothetical protein
MRSLSLSIVAAALISLTSAPVFAGQHGNSGNHGQSTHTPPAHPNKPPDAGPKSTGPSNDHGSKSQNDNGSKSHGPNANTPAPTNGPINFSTTALGLKLTKNTALQSKLATNLTALGYKGTVFEAAYGFKNLGQFVAATNVSQNLGIPFDKLKLQMTGLSVDANGIVTKANLNPDGTVSMVDPAKVTNPAPTKSLGQSIQTLKPTANATTAASTANKEAESEIEHTSKDSKKKS